MRRQASEFRAEIGRSRDFRGSAELARVQIVEFRYPKSNLHERLKFFLLLLDQAAQLAHGPDVQLAHALLGDAELFTDLFQG